MAVTEKLMAPGSFSVSLDLSLVPNAILNAIQPFDQIVITNGEVIISTTICLLFSFKMCVISHI